MWSDGILHSVLSLQLIDTGLATTQDLERISAARRSWAASADGWFSILYGEILARV